ncbi:MAG: hypothetical protein VYD63_01160, partial [Actinomycetota bacterium]|nr:hypothetical protein [Actinomycetota bacterium]
TTAAPTTAAPTTAAPTTAAPTTAAPTTAAPTTAAPTTAAPTTVAPITEIPSTTLFVLEAPPAPIDLEANELLRIVLTGDSITDQVAPYLEWILSRTATIEHRHLWGTALCDWFSDNRGDLGLEHLESWQPHLYIVDHGGNGITPCMADAAGLPLTDEAYTAKYLADTEYVVELALRTGSRVLLVDQPVSRGNFRSGTGEIYRSMPVRHPGGLVRFFSTWAALTPGGQFVQSAPCEATEPGCVDGRGELREPPPNVHLEALGAWRYAAAIVDELVAAGWVDAELVDITDRVMP